MIKKIDAFQKLLSIARAKFTHKYYQNCIDRRDEYTAMKSGEQADAAKLLKPFVRRENATAFDQRVALTQLITPALINVLNTPVKKLSNVKPIVNVLKYTDVNSENQQIMDDSISKYYGEKSLDDYLDEMLLDRGDTDPNAWLIHKFNDFDRFFEEPQVYSTRVACDNVVDFEFANDILMYLVVRVCINYELAPEVKATKLLPTVGVQQEPARSSEGFFYQIYAGDDEIEFEQVDPKKIISAISDSEVGLLMQIDSAYTIVNRNVDPDKAEIHNSESEYAYIVTPVKGQMFLVRFFEPKAGMVPCSRVGVIKDVTTDGNTCVALWHPSIAWLRKSIKTISELDLTQSLHVFPQKLELCPPCPGEVGPQNQMLGCKDGVQLDGKTQCRKCDGSGMISHTSAQDTIRMRMDKNKDANQVIKLSDMIYYAGLNIEIPKWLDDYIDKISVNSYLATYNSQIFQQQAIKTATEITFNMESVYDALSPLATHRASVRRMVVQLIAVYKSIDKNLINKYVYPHDLKMESVDAIIDRIQKVVTAGGSSYSIAEWNNLLDEQVFRDQPQRLKEIRTFKKFDIFEGLTKSEVQSQINSGNVLERDQIQYTYLNKIIKKLSLTYPGDASKEDNPSFFDMTDTKQASLIDAEVTAILAEIRTQKLAEMAAKANAFGTPMATA